MSDKGRMVRVTAYHVQCGAHACTNGAMVNGAAQLRLIGWHSDKGGYGWICPKCQEGGPLPEDQS